MNEYTIYAPRRKGRETRKYITEYQTIPNIEEMAEKERKESRIMLQITPKPEKGQNTFCATNQIRQCPTCTYVRNQLQTLNQRREEQQERKHLREKGKERRQRTDNDCGGHL